jgi:hypothetical protein
MTTNNGTSWQDIAGNLPDMPCNDIIADPAADSLLYLATDVGVYFTRDMGTNWNMLGTGMPTLVCNDLALHNPTHTLMAATYGRGMYKIDLSAALGAEEFKAQSLNLHIYPNPASKFIFISSDYKINELVELTITNVQGKKVYSNLLKTSNSKLKIKIDISNFSSGVYFVSAVINGKRNVEKLVVD